jgi:hypothetical protein
MNVAETLLTVVHSIRKGQIASSVFDAVSNFEVD